jgi:hypothetical protein
MKVYYGVRYYAEKDTTTGQPNPYTGYHSIACFFVAFTSKEELQAWVDDERLDEPWGRLGGKRESVTKAKLRKLLRGLTGEEFNKKILLLIEGL